ncbi:MAG TPA: carbohydrate ABC transporter permease, partial [Thermotogota bacterium]|nr:carbohydrate ABC transporter permease [Thermotogota bacterium]
MMKKTLIFILCLLIVLWFCGPVLLILIAALTPSAEYYDLARLVPTKLTLTHLESLFVRLNGWKATLISIQTALLSIVISFAIG